MTGRLYHDAAVRRLIDLVTPVRLGRDFRWLLASSWTTNLGDGIALAAGPLLIASQTDEPTIVASAFLLQQLPWMLVGLHAGVLADRIDRRRIIIAVNVIRAVILLVLVSFILTGTVDVTVVLVAMFLLGLSETVVDTTAPTLLPMLVDRDDLKVGNARLSFGFITLNQMVGVPIGATLFAVGRAVPFVAQACTIALGAILISRIVVPAPVRPRPPSTVREDIAEGLRWTRSHDAIRTLTLTIVAFNITFGAAWSILVLYASARLGLGEIGFGILMSVSAVGGIVGSVTYVAVERRIGMANIMRIGLIIETLTHLGLAVTKSAAVAMSILFVFGIHTVMWGMTSGTIRQRVVPRELQGRVASVYMMGLRGSLVVGSALGGVIAKTLGLTGPFWFGFVGSALILVWIWRRLAAVALAHA